MGNLRQIYLTDEEIDRLLEKLEVFHNDADAIYLGRKISSQQNYNPSDDQLPLSPEMKKIIANDDHQTHIRLYIESQQRKIEEAKANQ